MWKQIYCKTKACCELSLHSIKTELNDVQTTGQCWRCNILHSMINTSALKVRLKVHKFPFSAPDLLFKSCPFVLLINHSHESTFAQIVSLT